MSARELQGTGPWSDAGYRNGSDVESDLAAQGSGSAASAAWTWGPDQSAAEAAQLGRTPLPQPEVPPSLAAYSEATTPPVQTIVIIGNRPPGAAVDVVLPEALEAASTITDQDAPTQLLTGDAAAMALLRLGVGGATLDAMAATGAAAGRLVFYAGTRAVGYFVPGVGLMLTAELVYQIFDTAMSSAPGAAFTTPDGSVQRYLPAINGTLDLQTWTPGPAGSPEEADGTWIATGRFTPLSDEQRAQLLRPSATPMQPQGPQSPPPSQTHPDRIEPLSRP